MKNALTLVLITLLSMMGCNSPYSSKKSSQLSELDKWIKELYDNGIVGPPCDEDYQKWTENNPDYYFGLQEIKKIYYDFNHDNLIDTLFYFNAENCVGGNGYGSDFAMLLYSADNRFLTEKGVSKTIEQKINDEILRRYAPNIRETYIFFNDFNESIQGTFSTWISDDANCCPSYKGKFFYDILNNNISLDVKYNPSSVEKIFQVKQFSQAEFRDDNNEYFDAEVQIINISPFTFTKVSLGAKFKFVMPNGDIGTTHLYNADQSENFLTDDINNWKPNELKNFKIQTWFFYLTGGYPSFDYGRTPESITLNLVVNEAYAIDYELDNEESFASYNLLPLWIDKQTKLGLR